MGFLSRYIFQILGALIAVVYFVVGIFKSTNSTASIGFLFIPAAAAIGIFVGDTLKYLLDILRGKRSQSFGKTALILVVFGFGVYKFIQTQRYNQELQLAKSHSISDVELSALLKKNDARITHALASNSSIPIESLEKIIEEHLRDYYIMNGAIQHPGLSVASMKRIVSLEPSDFKSDTEYRLYQVQVWARLAKREDISEDLIHKLAGKNNPEHFLILALLESPFVSCGEKKRFLPQPNEVLESAIRRSMKSQACPQ